MPVIAAIRGALWRFANDITKWKAIGSCFRLSGLRKKTDPRNYLDDKLARILLNRHFEHGTLNLVGSGPVAILWRVATGHGFFIARLIHHLQLISSLDSQTHFS